MSSGKKGQDPKSGPVRNGVFAHTLVYVVQKFLPLFGLGQWMRVLGEMNEVSNASRIFGTEGQRSTPSEIVDEKVEYKVSHIRRCEQH